MQMWATAGNIDLATQTFAQMKADQIEPDTASFNILLVMYARFKNVTRLLQTYDEMRAAKVQFRLLIVSALMLKHCPDQFTESTLQSVLITNLSELPTIRGRQAFMLMQRRSPQRGHTDNTT